MSPSVRTWVTLVRRELWEHRALWIVPLALCGLMLVGTGLFGEFQVKSAEVMTASQRAGIVSVLATVMAAFVYLVTAAVLSFYLLDCLYGERRDRSILFWKSMPVSDTQTVLSKLLVALVVIPLGVFVLTLFTDLVLRGLLSIRQGGGAVNATFPIWNAQVWLKTQAVLGYALIASILWYAPVAAYFVLVSAWARRNAVLWSLLPAGVALLERMLFSTTYVTAFLLGRLSAPSPLAFGVSPSDDLSIKIDRNAVSSPERLFERIDPTGLFSSPELWLGLLAAIALTWGAIALRRYRDDT